jgi:hypothetical protein
MVSVAGLGLKGITQKVRCLLNLRIIPLLVLVIYGFYQVIIRF